MGPFVAFAAIEAGVSVAYLDTWIIGTRRYLAEHLASALFAPLEIEPVLPRGGIHHVLRILDGEHVAHLEMQLVSHYRFPSPPGFFAARRDCRLTHASSVET